MSVDDGTVADQTAEYWADLGRRAVAERPILFTDELINAIQDGRKTETRRLIKPRFGHFPATVRLNPVCVEAVTSNGKLRHVPCPYGEAGDLLYVRQAYAPNYFDPGHAYRSDFGPEDWAIAHAKWTPGIHMPKAHARLWLRVLEVRAERLHDIDDAGAWHEGVRSPLRMVGARRNAFARLWDSINGKREGGAWADNPPVWVVRFEVNHA